MRREKMIKRVEDIRLLPTPKEICSLEGCFELTGRAYIYTTTALSERFEILKSFSHAVKSTLGLELHFAGGDLCEKGDILLADCKDMGEEEFKIEITENNLTVVSGGFRGFLYASSFLTQLLKQTGASIPALRVHDFPDMRHRAYYLDQTRGRVLHMDELKKFVDKLAFYRYNELQIYIEHTYAFRHIEELWDDESCFTPEEIMELDDYCVKKGIELIPSLSCFGHLYKLLRIKRFQRFCERGEDNNEYSFLDRMGRHIVAVIEPEAQELIKSMLAEYMPLFRSKKVNICCDETFDLCEGKSKELLKDRSKKEIYIEYVKGLCDFVKSQGRTPMIWGDVIAGDTHLFKHLPEDTICLSWGYGTNEKDTFIRSLAERGICQYVCPGVSGWNHLINRIENCFINIRSMCEYGHTYNTMGIMVTDWGDYGHVNHPFFSVPGLIFSGVMAWNRKETGNDFLYFAELISLLEYDDSSRRAVCMLDRASKAEFFDWGDFVRFVDYYTRNKKAGRKEDCERMLKDLRSRYEGKDVSECNNVLDELKPAVPDVFGNSARIVENALEGQKLLNLSAVTICKGEKDEKLNSDMEKWFKEYKEIFLENSKPSDIERVHDVLKAFYGL